MSDFFNEMEEKVVKKRRDEAIDLLKFIAIYMVILGHCLGRLGLGMDVLDHPIGRLITMVNMPLFIFITGYFGQSLYKRSLLQLISVKYKTLLRPTIVYALLIVIICNYIIMSTPFSIIGGGQDLD